MGRADWRRPTTFLLQQGFRRIKLTLSYDGARFSGWQKQHTARSVQEEVEKALASLLRAPVRVQGSGRTDAKVHAIGQVAHFDCENQSIPAQAFTYALNQLLPHDIRITESEVVDERFHARFTSISREYRYIIRRNADYSPFDHNRVCRIQEFPQLSLLNEYASYIIGTHDFSTFSASGDQSHSRIRDIDVSEFFLTSSQWEKQSLVYRVRGNAFLMHQVRSMVGTMLQLGEKEIPSSEFATRLHACDRMQAGRTAPPEGLYLYRITYDQ